MPETMTKRDWFIAYKQQLEEYEKASQELFDKKRAIERQANNVRGEIIEEEELLAGEWIFSHLSSREISLRACRVNFDALQKLFDTPWYHIGFYLDPEETITLRYDDGDISLILPIEKAEDFIQRHKIEVDIDSLEEEKKRLETQLEHAKDIIANVKAVLPP